MTINEEQDKEEESAAEPTERCQFHLTVPAKKSGFIGECPGPVSRNIVSHYKNGMIIMDFCETHYQIMSDWLTNKG